MDEKSVYQKKAKTFIVIAAVISHAVTILFNVIYGHVSMNLGDDFYKMQCIQRAFSAVSDIIIWTAFFLMGKMLTKSNKKALIFTGSLYFGIISSNIVSSVFTTISRILMQTGTLSSSMAVQVIAVIPVVFLPLVAFLAYFVFSAFEGMNPRFCSQSLSTLETTLSSARKRVIAYLIISSAIISLFNYVPYIISVILGEAYSMSYIPAIASQIVSWLSDALAFATLYIVGYAASKKHIDALAFATIIKLSDNIASLFGKILRTTVDIVVNVLGLTSEENFSTVTAINSTSNLVISGLVTVLSLIIVMYLLKFFFPRVKSTVAGEQISGEDVFPQEQYPVTEE